MVIDLTSEQETLLLETARYEGTTLEEVITRAARWIARSEADDRASIERGLHQAERGEFIEEDEMERRFARMLRRQ